MHPRQARLEPTSGAASPRGHRPAGAATAIGLGALAGALAGLVVGFADGLRAAAPVGTGTGIALSTAALSGGVDALVGLAGGGLAELLLRLATWGRAVRAPRWANALALVIGGAASGAAAAGAVLGMALRHNRFLAAGLAALAGIGAAVGAVALAPALARVVGARGLSEGSPARSTAPAVILTPLLTAIAAGLLIATVSDTRAPLAGAALVRAAASAALAVVWLPAALLAAGQVRLPLGWRRAAPIAAAVYAVGAAVAVGLTWNDNLRFAPWTEIAIGGAIATLAVGLVWLARRSSWPRARVAAATAAVALVAAALVLRASESEPARKAATARAAFVGPLLAVGRRALDFDGDGYARALGGGDCDDRDPDVHPGAVDLPGDGVDADCDGQDATEALPPAAQMLDLPAAVPRDLNLLLITVDTLRADHLGCYGYSRPTSPAIDALAAEGALFENGWAHAPSTRYSMPAIASGRWPSAITWDESIWWPRLGPDVRTTAQALHELGYFTGGMFSFNYFALADHRGFERGMDVYRTDRAVLHVAVNGPMESRGSSSREMTDDAIAFVEAHRDGKFFLWLHYYDPHLSYEEHPEVPSFGASRVDRYDGEIRFTDLHFGRLVAALRAAGLWDRTAIVLTGDHGEGFGEHGVTEHGFDLYTAQTKVPFIVRVPGLPPRRVRVPVGHVDIAPTLVNLAGGKGEPAFIGRSLLADLSGPPAADTETRAVFQEVTSERGKKRAFVTASRHLIWNAEPGDTTECYDRTRDPTEEHDLWRGAAAGGDCSALARELRRLVAGLALPPGAAQKLAQAITAPGAAAPEPSHAVEARLGDGVTVRGYDLAPVAPRAGDTVEVTVHFGSAARLPPGWRLFFHLEGPSGFRNLDHVPVEGLMPLERWRPGQRIRDRLRFTLPPGSPAGTYTLYLGGYRGRERMRVEPAGGADGGNRLRLLSFAVGR